MANVGIVGVGFMGWIHYLAYQKIRGMKLTAICTRNKKKLAGDWRGIKGNFGPEGKKIDVSKIDCYDSFDKMLADPKIDLIDICLPPDLHAEFSIKAAKAGKHVLVEKPIAMSIAETKKMVAAAKKANTLLMTAHVLPFFDEYAFVLKAAQSGKYGKVLGGTFKRMISDPLWLPDFYDPVKVGGPMIDLHIHDAHFIRLLFGMPTAVTSQGRMRGEVLEYFNSQFDFEDSSLCVNAACGVINQQGRAFTHAFEVHFEKATMLFDFAVIDGEPRMLMPLTVLPNKGKAKQPKLGSGDPVDAFVAELKEAGKAISSGSPSTILGGDLAMDALVMCQKQTDSVAKGRKVRI
ncbi:MAG: oxidoreductase [Blastopirellula sp.]|nr:MAG: oxidoreductase [Blastopirellula sp.]